MDPVQVHYNSSRPAQLQALAYAQGSDIHLGPGQERHLPHEAWHGVQQAQGRVQPTQQQKKGVPINHYRGLEREADVMGAKALALGAQAGGAERAAPLRQPRPFVAGKGPVQRKLGFELEMRVLIDRNGRPVPEKTPVGHYGEHIDLHVDHGAEISTLTGHQGLPAGDERRPARRSGAPAGPTSGRSTARWRTRESSPPSSSCGTWCPQGATGTREPGGAASGCRAIGRVVSRRRCPRSSAKTAQDAGPRRALG